MAVRDRKCSWPWFLDVLGIRKSYEWDSPQMIILMGKVMIDDQTLEMPHSQANPKWNLNESWTDFRDIVLNSVSLCARKEIQVGMICSIYIKQKQCIFFATHQGSPSTAKWLIREEQPEIAHGFGRELPHNTSGWASVVSCLILLNPSLIGEVQVPILVI